MNRDRSETFARVLDESRSRRTVLKALAGGGAAGALAFLGRPGAGVVSAAALPDSVLAQQSVTVEIIAAALTLVKDSNDHKNGTLTLDQQRLRAHSNDLDPQLVSHLKRLVSDFNEKKIGIAVFDQDGQSFQLYGSPKTLERGVGPTSAQVLTSVPGVLSNPIAAADQMFKVDSASALVARPLNSTWVNWYGVHIYLDSYWTGLLDDQVSWAISIVAGLIVTALCSAGVACLVAGVIVAWVWNFLVAAITRPMYPHDLIIHCPWWGYVNVQPMKSGAWYNNRWFQSSLWT